MGSGAEITLSMLVVADTTPINYLVLIEQVEILPRLYARVLVPPAVIEELTHPSTPECVRAWASRPPVWLQRFAPRNSIVAERLDPGEREAIALAIETHADLLLIDEVAGRQEATRRGLRVAGTLSVLDQAERAGLLEFDVAVSRLCETSFRISQRVLDEIKERRSR